MEVKPDIKAKTFSPQNAFFFATLSSIAYKAKGDAKGLVAGNSTCEGMGFDHFYWFEVLFVRDGSSRCSSTTAM